MRTYSYVFCLLICLIPVVKGQTQASEADQVDPDEFEEVETESLTRFCVFGCPSGLTPLPNPDHSPSHNGCGAFGIFIDFKSCSYLNDCCKQHDICYETCGKIRAECDMEFRTCSSTPISVNGTTTQACTRYGGAMFHLVRAVGCLAFRNGQKRACICQ